MVKFPFWRASVWRNWWKNSGGSTLLRHVVVLVVGDPHQNMNIQRTSKNNMFETGNPIHYIPELVVFSWLRFSLRMVNRHTISQSDPVKSPNFASEIPLNPPSSLIFAMCPMSCAETAGQHSQHSQCQCHRTRGPAARRRWRAMAPWQDLSPGVRHLVKEKISGKCALYIYNTSI